MGSGFRHQNGWIATFNADDATSAAPVPASKFTGAMEQSVWLPSESIAVAWTEYMKDTVVADTTPPPEPTSVRVEGNVLTWSAEADLESGLAGFIIERDGQFLANVPEQGKNPFGRPIFQISLTAIHPRNNSGRCALSTRPPNPPRPFDIASSP